MKSSSRQFRPVASSAEIDKVVSLAKIIWTEHYAPLIGQEQVAFMLANFHSKQAIEAEIEDEGFNFFLLENGGKDVGYLSFSLRESALFLSKLYVLSSERGQGNGKSALEFLCDQAKQSNRQKISLTVAKKNSGSIAAYEKIGFWKTGEKKSDIGEGYFMDDFTMELEI